MPVDFVFLAGLRSIAAFISLALAIRDRQGFLLCLRAFAIGFIVGIVGLIARARMDRSMVHYGHVLQDALLNLGCEAVAVFGIPHFLK
ncbi:MAG TPA: hypothetical protein VMO17_20145 [Terriglobia bacterium]|nr:hypothetical protein [Terriglobia bacterium]